MRTSIYILAAVAMAGFTTASAQTTGNQATPSRTPPPARQPAASPPSATPMPSAETSPRRAQPTQQTVRPPDSQRAKDPEDSKLNPANNQQRVPPTSRGVGATGKPDCSKLRGLEKSECERRDTTRDDLPAGVTPSQAEK